MPLFGSGGANAILGVDLSTSGIKIVEIENSKTESKLLTYGYTEFPFSLEEANFLEDAKNSSELLKKVLTESGAKTRKAIGGLPMSQVFSSIINVPFVPDKDIAGYVSSQAQKLVSSPITEMQLDWQVLDREEAQKEHKKNLRVLINGARRDLIQKYVMIYQLAGVELMSLEPEAFALIRSLVGKDPGTLMVVDIGSSRTNICILEKGIPMLNRSIKVGGKALTQKLSGLLGMGLPETEETKRDIQFLKGLGTEGFPKALEETLQPIINDISYIFQQFNEDQTAVRLGSIEKIILAGGSSAFPNLAEYLKAKLQINVYRGDPWSRLAYPESLAPVLDEIGPRFAVAVGLALKQ
ncbi:MAG: type IV pilus assembly protein PilM [bacterium]